MTTAIIYVIMYDLVSNILFALSYLLKLAVNDVERENSQSTSRFVEVVNLQTWEGSVALPQGDLKGSKSRDAMLSLTLRPLEGNGDKEISIRL